MKSRRGSRDGEKRGELQWVMIATAARLRYSLALGRWSSERGWLRSYGHQTWFWSFTSNRLKPSQLFGMRRFRWQQVEANVVQLQTQHPANQKFVELQLGIADKNPAG
jgi:hypothetical protein